MMNGTLKGGILLIFDRIIRYENTALSYSGFRRLSDRFLQNAPIDNHS